MALGDDIALVLPDLRISAISTMIDSVRITRDAPAVFDPNTGGMAPGVGALVYEGICRLRMSAAVEAQVMFGEVQVTITRYILAVPYGVTAVRVGDLATMLESADPDALDQTYRVTYAPAGTDLILKSFGVETVE